MHGPSLPEALRGVMRLLRPNEVAVSTAVTSKTKNVHEKTPEKMSAAELWEEGMGVVRDFLSHRGFSMLAKETSGADVIFYDAESAATILTRVAIDAGSIDDEKAIPELDRKDIAEMHAMCLAYAAARPSVSCVRADVLSLTLMAERQGRILHLIGTYMWEEWLHGT